LLEKTLVIMPVKTFRPLTPSTRYITIADFSDITKTKPEKSLVEIRKKTGDRNAYSRVSARSNGGGTCNPPLQFCFVCYLPPRKIIMPEKSASRFG